MRRWENTELLHLPLSITGEWMDVIQGINLVTKELDAHAQFLICGNDIDDVALRAECAASKGDIIAVILDIDEEAKELIAVNLHPGPQHH